MINSYFPICQKVCSLCCLCALFLIKDYYERRDIQRWSKHDLHNIVHMYMVDFWNGHVCVLALVHLALFILRQCVFHFFSHLSKILSCLSILYIQFWVSWKHFPSLYMSMFLGTLVKVLLICFLIKFLTEGRNHDYESPFPFCRSFILMPFSRKSLMLSN